MAELAEIVRGSVGELMVSLGPHVLGRIEFRRVRREVVDVESGVLSEERADLTPSMDGTAIPEQVDRTTQVAEKVAEERLDVETGEVAGPTAGGRAPPAAAWATPPARCTPTSDRGGTGGGGTASGPWAPTSGRRWG
jgi:hypothetical protein